MKCGIRFPAGLALLCLFASCDKTLYQVDLTASENVAPVNNYYAYSDSVVDVYYRLWAKGGKLEYGIHNNTTKPLYIDWKSGFLSYNGNRISYVTAVDPETAGRALPVVTDQDLPTLVPPGEWIPVSKVDLRRDYFDPGTTDKKAPAFEAHYDSTTSPMVFRNVLYFSHDSAFANPVRVANTFWVTEIKSMDADGFYRFKGANGPNHGFYTKGYVKDQAATNVGIVVGSLVGVVALISIAGFVALISSL